MRYYVAGLRPSITFPRENTCQINVLDPTTLKANSGARRFCLFHSKEFHACRL